MPLHPGDAAPDVTLPATDKTQVSLASLWSEQPLVLMFFPLAFTSTCTHMGCTVAEVSGGVIRCNCHGSQFSIKDGSVANPPASQPLAEHKVTVSGGKVFVTE